MDDISVDFSGEELLALSRLARVEALAGVESVAATADPPTSRAVLGAVERGLTARRMLSPTEDGLELFPVARQLIITLARPALRARASWAEGGTRTELQCAAIGPVAVELRSVEGGVYRLTPFAPEELLARLLARLPLPPASEAAAAPGPRQGFRLPRGDLRQALRLGRNDDAATARFVLAGRASPAGAARIFGDALGPGQVTVALEVTYLAGDGKVRGGEVSWVDGGPSGLWNLPPGWEDPAFAAHDAAPVTPVEAGELRREIVSYFPPAPLPAAPPGAGSGPAPPPGAGENPSRGAGSRVEP